MYNLQPQQLSHTPYQQSKLTDLPSTPTTQAPTPIKATPNPTTTPLSKQVGRRYETNDVPFVSRKKGNTYIP